MDVLKGRILERVTIKGTLTDTAQINGGLNVPKVVYPPTYQGDYTVTPTEETQTLQTKELYLNDDITVNAIDSEYVGRRWGLWSLCLFLNLRRNAHYKKKIQFNQHINNKQYIFN